MNKDQPELKFIRVFTSSHVPKYLVEQIKHRDFTVEDWYKYQEANLLEKSSEFKLNPLHHLYVMTDEKNHVKGMLFYTVNPLDKSIFLQNYSVDKDYWMKGVAVKMATEHVLRVKKQAKLGKIYWHTRYPKHALKNGFKQAKDVLMVYEEKE